MSFLDSYEPVEARLAKFWEDNPEGRIETELVSHEDGAWIFKASIWRKKTSGPSGILETDAQITREQAEHIMSLWKASPDTGLISGARFVPVPQYPDATGYAHERETQKGVNSTSAAENCETSAIGRALANLGYAPKGARPSREEMSKAERSQRVEGRASSPAREVAPGPPPPEGFSTHEESHKEIEFCRNGIATFGLEDWVKDQNFPWPWPKAACDAIAAKIAKATTESEPF